MQRGNTRLEQIELNYLPDTAPRTLVSEEGVAAVSGRRSGVLSRGSWSKENVVEPMVPGTASPPVVSAPVPLAVDKARTSGRT